MAVQFFLVLIWMNFSEQALQMLKEHPTYKDDDEIQGSKTWFSDLVVPSLIREPQ